MKIYISSDSDEDDLELEGNYILAVSDDSTFVGGLLCTSDIIEAISRLIVASHISVKELENDDKYTLKRYLEDIVDECCYIKEKLGENNENFKLNRKDSHTTISVDLNALKNQMNQATEFNFDELLNYLNDLDNKDLDDEDEEDEDDSI